MHRIPRQGTVQLTLPGLSLGRLACGLKLCLLYRMTQFITAPLSPPLTPLALRVVLAVTCVR
jgi:hypothetical protein